MSAPHSALHDALVTDLDAGFAQLVGEYADVVHAVARRHVEQACDAEDLAAEAFLRAYRALRSYDEQRRRGLDLRPWLLTIVLNLARNRRRDAARRPRIDPTDVPPETPAARPCPSDTVADDHLVALLADLPRAQRTAVVLRHVVDLPIAEVAATLGCPEGTARSHVSRGLAALRRSYPTVEEP